ncbi:5-oxoprolinase subunit PxpA [Arthrobacter ginkgonis]|uniref:5-oxoprolinase subunit PxpA n=2 Tax=Arthrobacter ginkgonis TaxID=1630594 RepID=A0ABP7CMG0_9MICC
MKTFDINADAGESFGRWKLGNDSELFKYVTTVNIACGYHAGDPATMRETVAKARDNGLAVGAHPGYPDLLGFGRRAIPVTEADAVDYMLYQVGALQGIAASEGVRLSHVKPHGSLYAEVARNPGLAVRISTLLQRLQPGLPMLIAPGPSTEKLREAGLPVVAENAVDLDFDDQGQNIIEKTPASKDPDTIAGQALLMANGQARTVSGAVIPMPVQSMCIHGDRPNAVDIARSVRLALEESNITVRSVFGSEN